MVITIRLCNEIFGLVMSDNNTKLLISDAFESGGAKRSKDLLHDRHKMITRWLENNQFLILDVN